MDITFCEGKNKKGEKCSLRKKCKRYIANKNSKNIGIMQSYF